MSAMLIALALLIALPPLSRAENYRGHGLSLHGELKYGPGFEYFDYVNPLAPKGGEIRLGEEGTFDSLNPFILKGIAPAALRFYVYDSLLEGSDDEAFSSYGRLAESVEVASDYSWAIFTLRQEARWHDGVPITSADVLFTVDKFKTEAHPGLRGYYAAIERAEAVDERRVKLIFSGDLNRELPFIAGQIQVLPKHYWESRDFARTTLEPPLGSGPYRVAALEPGRFITFERVDDYWGRDLPVNRGRFNFERVHYDYYRDTTVLIEALKAGENDFRQENSSKHWASSYDIPAVADGRLIKEAIYHRRPTGMQAFWFNTRRGKFADRQVRQALAYAFDFEWTNTNLFYGQYTRTRSFFSNSELASTGLPGGRELEILEAYRERVPEEVFTTPYAPPVTDGSGQIRQNLRTARNLLKAAGWNVVDNALIHGQTGERMEIEFLLGSASFERVVAPIARNLERLGVTSNIRTVDDAQYVNRMSEFDYDVVVGSQGQSMSPGNEQTNYWHSTTAAEPGSRNRAGIADPVVDELIERLIKAPDREELVALTRALDRVLLWGHYVIPNWHINYLRTLRWDKFGKPDESPPYPSLYLTTWWYDAEKAANLNPAD
jgi:microcin C transport system substrate-binding protein